MDVINKLYSSVSSTVSQFSGVLPGNPVTREFEATQFIASAGPGLLWKVYKGYKKSTKQEASIFVFEKRSLERWTKADRDIVLETLKRGVTQLTKLRHPQILTVQHSLEESRESLAFATEPVFASLANILGNTENMPQPMPPHLANYKLYEVEIKYGLLQVAEGLSFLHNDVKLFHHNICPESIVVNQQGAWKIFGFDFCVLNQNVSGAVPFWPFVEYCPALHPATQPPLDFLAPEYVLTSSHSSASDIYSLGMLIYCLHSHGSQTLGGIQNDYVKFKRFANDLKQLPPSKLSCVAEGLRDYVKLMLNVTPELRPDPHQFIKIPYFEDVGVKTLNYLDSLFQWDNLQKSQFFKGLPPIIKKLPHRVCIYRILPCLGKEFVNPTMVPFVLPNALLIAENSTKEEFVNYILPLLKSVMVMQEPIQILLIFMQKMELLLKLTPPEEIKSDVLPMLYRALESDAQQIQELCLSVLPTFASLIDYPAMKNALLPRIKKLCLTTNYLSVRVNCLLCLGKLLEHLDKWLVLDELIPFLPQIPSREPAVLMGILGIYKLALTNKKLGITKEIMASKVIPFLMPLCIENGLTLNQFNALITLVKTMVATVETEHRVKLEQLNSIQNESRTFEQSMVITPSGDNMLIAAPPPQTEVDDMFSGLGLDSYARTSVESTKPPDNIPITNCPTTNSLTIEDKQRLAQQQENVQRTSNRNVIEVKRNISSKTQTHSKPLDLTSSLMQSNLNQITGSGKPTPSSSSNNVQNPMESTWTRNSQNMTIGNLPQNSYSTNMNSNIHSWRNGNINVSDASKPHWSAFDSLLPQSQPKVPLNQMISSPLLSSSSTNNPNNVVNSNGNIKQLSKKDLMDLLG